MLQGCFNLLLPLFLSLLLCVCCHGRTISLHPATQLCPVNAVTIEMGEDETNTSVPSCMSLDEALEILDSDDQLLLSPGLYTLRNFSTDVVKEVSNVTIIGDPANPHNVIVTCAENVGLFFFNVSNLSISGLTVQQCGISGVDRINKIINMTREIIRLVQYPLPDFSAAMFLIHCPDLQLSDMVIRDNRGFGLVGVNLIGSTAFTRVHVMQNYPSSCVLDLIWYERIGGSGGGMFLVYQDYVGVWFKEFRRTYTEFSFTNSNITDNFVCRLNLFHVLHDKLPRSIRTPQSLNFSMVGAGGITVSMAQSIFQANVFFKSCVFRNNSGTYNGAAMHISQFELSSNSHVFVEDTIFEENGQELSARYGSSGMGPAGALHIWYYTPNPSDHNNIRLSRRLLTQLPSSVVVSRSKFLRNVARSGAGICVISFGPEVGVIQDLLVVDDTVFKFNEAEFGSAMYLTELSYSGFEVGLRVQLSNMNVTRNVKRDNSAGRSLQLGSGIIDINFLNVSMRGNNYFGYNDNTAISLNSALITMSGTVLMEFNIGSTGGAIDLMSESYMVMTGSTNITFYRNTALIAGGAIHVNFDSTRFNTYDCFAFLGNPDFFCNLFGRCIEEPVSASFIGNSAPLGSTLYGSTFTNCPWASGTFDSTAKPRENIICTLLFLQPFVTISPSLIGGDPNIINTLPRRIVPSEEGLEFTAMPGKMLEADLVALDELDQSVPLTVYSQVKGGVTGEGGSNIGATNRYLIDGENGSFTTVPVQVTGVENSTYTLVITSDEAEVEFSFNVTLTNCSLGLVYNNESRICECVIQDIIDGASCENDGSVTFQTGPWIGFIKNHGFATVRCIYNYCYDNVTRIFLDNPDSQCRDNRAGILCGRCREGYSRVLGGSNCIQCNNNNISLIIAFAILGLLLVVMISIFNITITDGYINGMIFYYNILSLYLNVSVVPPSIFSPQAAELMIYLINLNFAFEACFYDGMTDLDLAVLSLLFPLYLGMILLVITIISKYCHNRHFAKLLSKVNITHVFATLLLLTYTRIIRTCIDILSYINITSSQGRTLHLWRIDPNQKYLEGLHILEFIVALFLIIILLPFPILLLFPQATLRLPYVSRLKPLIDAFVAPLADGKRFWVGFRILCRNFFFMLIFLEDQPRNITLCTFIILITVLEACIKPFKTPFRNFLDIYAMVNLTLFSFLVAVGESSPVAIKFAFILLILFGLAVHVLILFYLIMAFPCSGRLWKRVCTHWEESIQPRLLWFKSIGNGEVTSNVQSQKRKKSSYDLTEEVTHTSFAVGIPEGGDDRDFHTTGFVGYRESLFEPGSSNKSSSSINKSNTNSL